MNELPFQRLAVYCSSSNHVAPAYFDAARAVGELLAERGVAVVFGGGSVGLMGALADAVHARGGTTIGVIPAKLLDLELAHRDLSAHYVVGGMQERKRLMAELADGFIALPGGWGTLEELFEVAVASLLNYHRKPFGLLNVDGYYDKLLEFLARAEAERFVSPAQGALLQVSEHPGELLELLAGCQIPLLDRANLPAGANTDG